MKFKTNIDFDMLISQGICSGRLYIQLIPGLPKVF